MMSPGGLGMPTLPVDLTTRFCTIPKLRDPRGYIIPADQAGFRHRDEVRQRTC
jgi:hypothetical protein